MLWLLDLKANINSEDDSGGESGQDEDRIPTETPPPLRRPKRLSPDGSAPLLAQGGLGHRKFRQSGAVPARAWPGPLATVAELGTAPSAGAAVSPEDRCRWGGSRRWG